MPEASKTVRPDGKQNHTVMTRGGKTLLITAIGQGGMALTITDSGPGMPNMVVLTSEQMIAFAEVVFNILEDWR